MIMTLTKRFEEAVVYATTVHAGQIRRKTGMPFVAHLLGVASLVLEHHGSETEAIAALLHDAVEDAGGRSRLTDIRARFGDEIGDIVAGCTDSDEFPPPPWRTRKENYLNHLPTASKSVLLVSAADKLHNARALLRTLRIHGDEIWTRYSGGVDGTLWYYRALAESFGKTGPVDLADELAFTVSRIESHTDEPKKSGGAGKSAR